MQRHICELGYGQPKGKRKYSVKGRGNTIKVGIMTWYKYLNYGTALQVTALSKKIADFGYLPYVIQYDPTLNFPAVPSSFGVSLFFRKAVDKLLSIMLVPKIYRTNERKRLYNDYLEARLKETGECFTEDALRALNGSFDAFVCGSDQVWSPLCFDDKYFLSFVEDPSRMVAYAPSMGAMEIADKTIQAEMAKLLRRFSQLSVRELQGAKMIRELTGQEAKVLLDPTLLLTAEEWDSFADTDLAPRIETPYILSYYLGDPTRYRKYVRRVSKKTGLPIYEIPIRRVWGKYSKFPFEVGPREFVALIRNATFVCTDSFHGLAFSVNYNVPFSVFERFEKDDPKNQNSRIYSILELLGLQERLISPASTGSFDHLLKPPIHETTQTRLDRLRQESLQFLKSSLEAIATKE